MSDDQNLDPFASMEATMSDAFDRMNTDEPAEEQNDNETAPADTDESDVVEAIGDDGEQDASASAPDDDGGDADEGTDQANDDGDGADADASLSPPSRWSAADKAEFETLTPDAQKLVLKRERDIERHLTQKSQEVSEAQKAIGAVNGIIDQRKGAWAASGMTPDQAVSQLFQLSDFAGQNPQGFIEWFAQQHGLTAPTQATAADDDYGDPEIQSLKAEVEQLRAMAYQQTHQQQQHQQQTVQQVIQEFSKDAQNAPYFAELETEIADILQSVKQANPGGSPREWLKTAYDKAVWLNESTRTREIERAQTRKRDTERKKAARAKKASGVNIRGSAGNGVDEAVAESMEATMSRAYDQAMSG